MAKIIIPRVMPGDKITADLFNKLAEAAERGQINQGNSPGLEVSKGRGGTTLNVKFNKPIWAKLTMNNTGGSYNFTEQYPASGGGFTAGTRTGKCYEINGNATISLVSTVIVELTLSTAGDWLFQFDKCP